MGPAMTNLTPTEVTQALFDSIVRGDWQGAAALGDVDGLARWRAGELAFLAAEADFLARWPEPTAGGSLTAVPTDEAVIAQCLQKYAATVLPGLPTRTTLAELVSFPAAKLFAMYLQLTAWLRMDGDLTSSPQIVGEKIESDSTAVVVYRWHGAGWPKEPQEASILQLHRGPNGWRYVPAPDVPATYFAFIKLPATLRRAVLAAA